MDINKQEENINEESINIEANNESDVENTKDLDIENSNIENEIEDETKIQEDFEENNTVNIENKVGFGDAFIATLVDIIATGLVSVAGLFIFDAILKAIAGYYVKDVIPMFIIIYLIVTLLYTSIMESSKNADTIGKRVARLKLVKTQ
jgi:hypothetical protein